MGKKKEIFREVEFTFSDDNSGFGEKDGIVECELCGSSYSILEVVTMLRGFLVCPSCILAPPSVTATIIEKRTENRNAMGAWGDTPEDREELKDELLEVAKTLRNTKHMNGDFLMFEDIPGGITAQALAEATKRIRPPRRRKTA